MLQKLIDAAVEGEQLLKTQIIAYFENSTRILKRNCTSNQNLIDQISE